MIERDDDVSRRYRALAREEPPAALDEAILAASRRAVAARPGGLRRWSGPLSIAAVLVLSVGVVMKMQTEQPDVATSAPVERAPVAEATAPVVKDVQPDKPAAPVVPARAPAAPPPAARARQEKRVQPTPPPTAAAEKATAPVAQSAEPLVRPAPAAPAAPAESTAGASPERQPRQMTLANAAAPPPPAAFAPSIAKRSAAARDTSTEDLASRPVESPEATLERIAKLRAEGRDDEADRALEAFRKEHPDFRIPEATWEKVRRRTP